MNLKRSFTPLALVLVGAIPLAGQETVGTLVGTVSDGATKKALVGAKLILRSPKILGDRVITTAADGGFRIPLLPNGAYSLTTSMDGYNAATVHLAITPGQTTRQNVHLSPVQTAVVEVMANYAAQVDKTETTVQTAFDMDKLTSIVSGTSLTSILELAPGVMANGNAQEGMAIQVRGGNTTGARFLLNGIDASDPGWGTFNPERMMITDMVESVAIIASPLNARYGNTESGMISYVTTRGSNDFKGAIRTSYTVDGTFGATGQTSRSVPRYGVDDDPRWRTPMPDGAAQRNYEVTISGPIWKDHITFAYGGRFLPQTSGVQQRTKDWNPDTNNFSNSFGGTLYPLPGGAEIRPANVYDMGKTYATKNTDTFNQYALFWQINQNHSLDWSYSEFKNESLGLESGAADLSSPAYATVTNTNRIWNLAYKGQVGPGVLEARLGRATYEIDRPDTTGIAQIHVLTMPTWKNFGIGTGLGLHSTQELGPYGGATSLYPYNNLFEAKKYGPYELSANVNGSAFDRGETRTNTSFLANYQMALGEHLVDVGVNYVKTFWDTAIGDSEVSVNVPGGQISSTLTDSQILYPKGYAGPQYSAADYAGKWVVWDALASTKALYPGYSGDVSGNNKYAYSGLGVPTMTKYYGSENGGYDEKTTSLYVNDIWQVNNKWTVMAGLRDDFFKLQDSVGTVLSYSTLSPRVEVKYDLNGDQKRVLSYSWAKFQNRMPSAAFLSLVHRRKPYSITTAWSAGAPAGNGVDASGNSNPGAYQLVSTQELLNPANYTYFTAQNNPDIYRLGKDFRGDYCVEQTVNYNRAYDNGSNIRATLLYRRWFDNYQWFMDPHASYITNPYAPAATTALAKENDPTWTTHRELRNDSGLFHTYTSAELEWNFVLSKRLTFSGNYVYSKNYSNQMYYAAQSNYSMDNVGVRHAPWGINLPDVWSLVGLNLNDIAQRDVVRNQVANAWFTLDLSTGALKQSLALRGNWQLGSTYTAFWWGTTIDPNSSAWKAITAAANVPADFPTAKNISQNYGTAMYLAYPGTNIGDWKNPDIISYNLKYNLEVPIGEKLRWWCGIDIINFLNHAYSRDQVSYQFSDISGYNRDGVFAADGHNGPITPAANGYHIPGYQMYKPGPDFVEGGRYFIFETGLKF